MNTYTIIKELFRCHPVFKRYNVALYDDINAKVSVGVEVKEIVVNKPTDFRLRLLSPQNKVDTLLKRVDEINTLNNTVQEIEIKDKKYTIALKLGESTDEGIKDNQQLLYKQAQLTVYTQEV